MTRRPTLATQLLAMQTAIVLVVLVVAGVLAYRLQQRETRENYSDRVLLLARGLAIQREVGAAYELADPSVELQPLAELVRRAAGAEFVVFTDAAGIRYSHPDPSEIGRRVSTDPSVALGGAEFVGTEEGTLGVSLRAKVPVRNAAGDVEGQVSVGILERRLSADLDGLVRTLVLWLTGAAVVGVGGAVGVTRLVRRRIYGLEPEEIVELLQSSDAMRHGIREGVVAVDDRGRVAWINDQAVRLLDLQGDPIQRPIEEVLEPDLLLPMVRGGQDSSGRLALVGERVLVVNSTAGRVDGQEVGRVLVLRDRTELIEALRALEGQRTITDALRAQAHEFANHLHVLSGLIELDRHSEALDFIERVGGGAGPRDGLPFAGVDDAGVAALLLAKGATAREKGARLHLDPTSAVAHGAGDDVLTIAANLIDNAVEAGGMGADVILLIQHSTDAGVRIEVSDNGPGVSPDAKDRIFGIGVTTKVSHEGEEKNAHGIGLALVARIVTRRGGSVQVHDQPNGGARFVVVLPSPEAVAGRPGELVR